MSAKILAVAEGAGFAQDSALVKSFEVLGYEAKYFQLHHGLKRVDPKLLVEADAVLFRSPWSVGPEEALLVRALGRALRESLRSAGFNGFGDHQKVFGVGRGAWLLLEARLHPVPIDFQLSWVELMGRDVSWIECLKSGDHESVYPCLLSGRAIPSPENWKTLQAKPLLQYGNSAVAYTIGPLILSFVDCFALSHARQLRAFGFENLEKVKTRSKLLEEILEVT